MKANIKAYLKSLKDSGTKILDVMPYDVKIVALKYHGGYILIDIQEAATLAICEEIKEELGLVEPGLKAKFLKYFKRTKNAP